MRIAKYMEEWETEETVKTINGVTVCYQPQYAVKEWQQMNFKDNYIYRRKRNAQIDFPNLKIMRFKRDEIENPVYLD